MIRDRRRCAALIAIHPFLKAGVATILITVAALFLHPAPSVAVLLIFALHALFCPSVLLPALRLFMLAVAGFFGFAVVNALGYGGVETIHYALGPLSVSREGVLFSVSILLRLLASVSMAILISRTIHPAHLTAAIDGAAGKATGVALGILVVHRMVPDVVQRFSVTRSMRRVRGARGGIRALFDALPSVLASTIRRAETLSVAVRSRGYALGSRRTAFRRPSLRPGHLAWALMVLVLAVALVGWWEATHGISGFLAGTAEQTGGTVR